MGRPFGTKNIETPEELWQFFQDYVDFCRQNPYKEQQWVGRDGNEVQKNIMRHISFDGFEGWLSKEGIISDLGDYAKDKGKAYTDFSPIITHIRRVCRGELLTAAVSGVANGNVVSRYLGLKDSTDNVHTIKDYDISLDLNA